MDANYSFSPRSYDNGKMTWSDVWFKVALDVPAAYQTGDLAKFSYAVDSMQIVLSGRIDGDYEEGVEGYQETYDRESEDETRTFYYIKATELFKLLDRVHNPGVTLTEYELESKIIDSIVASIGNGIGQNIAITGPPGSGKSWACLRLGEVLRERTGGKFGMTHVCKDIKHFMKVLNDKEITPPGTIIVMEELGINANSKDSLSTINRVFTDTFQIVRYRGLVLIVNAPTLGLFDKTARMLLHWWFKTNKINRAAGYCEVKPFCVEIDQHRNEPKYPYPIAEKGQKITRLRIGRPSKEIAAEYEKFSEEFKDVISKRNEARVNSMAVNKEEQLEQEYKQYEEMRQAGNLQKVIMEELGMHTKKAATFERRFKIEHGKL